MFDAAFTHGICPWDESLNFTRGFPDLITDEENKISMVSDLSATRFLQECKWDAIWMSVASPTKSKRVCVFCFDELAKKDVGVLNCHQVVQVRGFPIETFPLTLIINARS